MPAGRNSSPGRPNQPARAVTGGGTSLHYLQLLFSPIALVLRMDCLYSVGGQVQTNTSDRLAAEGRRLETLEDAFSHLGSELFDQMEALKNQLANQSVSPVRQSQPSTPARSSTSDLQQAHAAMDGAKNVLAASKQGNEKAAVKQQEVGGAWRAGQGRWSETGRETASVRQTDIVKDKDRLTVSERA